MTTSALDKLSAISSYEIAARLSGLPEERAAFVRVVAEAGLAEAQAVYGQMCLDAGVSAEALDWFMRAAAQHHVMAINMVGRCYDLGWGTNVDKVRAAACYRAAADAGLDWAMYNYAISSRTPSAAGRISAASTRATTSSPQNSCQPWRSPPPSPFLL